MAYQFAYSLFRPTTFFDRRFVETARSGLTIPRKTAVKNLLGAAYVDHVFDARLSPKLQHTEVDPPKYGKRNPIAD